MNLTSQTLGDYRLESVIARGPRATVYRARHAGDGRIVAVKVYDGSVDPDAARRAVEAVEALTQANVLPVIGFGVHQGYAYMATRHMPKGSIQSRRRAMPLNEIARILPHITAALDHAHEHGLLHLNLKPSNILLDHPGNAFVADFGIPAQADSPYAAPEVGRGPVDARADVYGLGAVLYELLTGRAPVIRRPRGDDKTNLRPIDLPAPRSMQPDVPPAVEAVIMRAMSIDPQARYAAPGALAAAFAEAVQTAASDRPAAPVRPFFPRWIALGVIGVLLVVVAILAASGSSAPAVVVTATPTPMPAASEPPSPAPTHTHTPTSTLTRTPTRRPASPTASDTPAGTPTPAASPTRIITTARPTLTPSPAFSVVSLDLKEPPTRTDLRDRLDLFFDAVVQPSVGGPYGQLFAYLPDIDSLVTARIGAQVSSAAQLLHVTLIVDCSRLPRPFTTGRVFLEIRETDRGPALYSASIEYLKTWCR